MKRVLTNTSVSQMYPQIFAAKSSCDPVLSTSVWASPVRKIGDSKRDFASLESTGYAIPSRPLALLS